MLPAVVDLKWKEPASKKKLLLFGLNRRRNGKEIVENIETVIMEGKNDSAKAVNSKNGKIQRKILMVFYMTIPNSR